ncbi:hypothetical protein CDAR_271111 [Caerostris darwini]|uniref:FYVE and coiled-coil domain-containing protein 1 n=1 Tax=Caerostris darwini TaxID=1538125 RepID=A0AAV4TAN2_9ARAC|nr:hypothetical protein CDAR_271111 [Caerostris darwini]
MASCTVTSKALLDIEACIVELKKRFSVEKIPINDDCAVLHQLEEKLETILLLGLKENGGVFGVKRSYWDYIVTCFSVSKRLHEGIKFVKSNSELKSSLGRGRALIRFCFMQKCLADTLQSCFIDHKTTRDFYSDRCLPLQPKRWSSLVTFLYDLNEINFDLNSQNSELDISWPSFARKVFVPFGNEVLPFMNMDSGSNDFSSKISNEIEIHDTDNDVKADCEMTNNHNANSIDVTKNCVEDIDMELNLHSSSNLKTQCSTLNDKSNLIDASNSEISASNISSNLELKSLETILTVCDSSALTNLNFTKSFLQENIDNLLETEINPFHPDISNSLKKLILEMKAVLNNLENSINLSIKDPTALSQITCLKIIRDCVEKILFCELKKIKHCKVKNQSLEEFACYVESLVLNQDSLIHSLLDRINSSVKDNENLYDRICFLKDKLHSFGLLKVQTENNVDFKINSKLLDESITNAIVVPECINFEHSEDMGNNFLESLTILRNSSTKLHTLNKQASSLKLLLDSSHKLNENLISRIQDQELHMKGITKQLEEAHNLLSVMKKQHQKLQSAENIVKYDLQEKRKLLTKLKQQLEATRENCNLVRLKNSKSEAEWQTLRKEFVQRNKQNSEESGFIDDKGIEDQTSAVVNSVYDCNINDNVPDNSLPLDNNDIETKYELKKNRLQLLEEQCQILCTNLKNSSKKRKEIDHRLESWCKAIESSHKENSHKLTEILSSEEGKSTIDESTSEKIIIDSNSDVDSSLSSPEIGSLNSNCCSFIPQDSNIISTDLSISLQSLKNDEFIPSINLECNQSKSPFEEENSIHSDHILKEIGDNSSESIENAASSCALVESVEFFKEAKENQMQTLIQSTSDVLTQVKPYEIPCSYEESQLVQSPLCNSTFEDLSELVSKLEKEKKMLQLKCQDLEIKIVMISDEFNQKIQELKLSEAAKKQEVVALQFQLNSEVLKYESIIKEFSNNNEGLKEMKQKVSDQEQLILTLEEALAEIQVEREGEKEHQWEQLQDIQLALSTREEECASLSSKMLEEFKMSNLKDREILENEIMHLRNDTKELQKKVIRLLKEKDILWKANDRLRYFHKMQIDDRWIDDHEVSECLGCRSQFSFLLRKHHCRQCGRIFCSSCSNNWLSTPSSRRQIRVCNECYMHRIEIKTDVRRDSNVQYCEESEDEAVVDDMSLNLNRSSSLSSEIHSTIADSIISLPAMHVTNLKQKSHFTSAPELHFSLDNQDILKRSSLNESILPSHMEIIENDINGNILIKANDEAILPILNEVNSTSISWKFEPPCEAIPIMLVYEDATHCSQQTVMHQSSCETEGVIHLFLPGLYKFHFDNKSRPSSMLVHYSFKANILKEQEITC